MNIGSAVKTLPTVKPKLYAGRQGVIATRNEDEWGVLINGRVVWFLEREIEENGSTDGDTRDNGHTNGAAGGSRVVTSQSPVQQPRAPGLSRGMAATSPVAQSGPERPMTKPASPVPGSEPLSALNPVSAAPGPAPSLSGLTPGERGPGGGVVARCGGCGGLWERPKARGRPARMCEPCRASV